MVVRPELVGGGGQGGGVKGDGRGEEEKGRKGKEGGRKGERREKTEWEMSWPAPGCRQWW